MGVRIERKVLRDDQMPPTLWDPGDIELLGFGVWRHADRFVVFLPVALLVILIAAFGLSASPAGTTMICSISGNWIAGLWTVIERSIRAARCTFTTGAVATGGGGGAGAAATFGGGAAAASLVGGTKDFVLVTVPNLNWMRCSEPSAGRLEL